jgi:hypothetical protein
MGSHLSLFCTLFSHHLPLPPPLPLSLSPLLLALLHTFSSSFSLFLSHLLFLPFFPILTPSYSLSLSLSFTLFLSLTLSLSFIFSHKHPLTDIGVTPKILLRFSNFNNVFMIHLNLIFNTFLFKKKVNTSKFFSQKNYFRKSLFRFPAFIILHFALKTQSMYIP